jgi:putative CocE/NonD family hydrolase
MEMVRDGSGILARLRGRAVDMAMGLPYADTKLEVRCNLASPMRDGVSLLGDLFRPEDASGPLPVVLVRSPYGRTGMVGAVFGAATARRGFQVFLQSTRGTFGSGGLFRPFATEHEDGLDTVAWLREQPWCDGRVAMTGGSYLGHTQWAVAPYADPPLVCVAPHVSAAHVTLAFYQHGAPVLANALNWTADIGRQEGGGIPPIFPNPIRSRRNRRMMAELPLQAADVGVARAPVPFWRDFVEHAAPFDTFWGSADHSRVDMSRMPPASVVTGWWDLFLAAQLADFSALRAAGNPARIMVGPWLHGEPAELRQITLSDVAWLKHHLQGGPAPEGAPVRVALQQTEDWLEFDEWPPPEMAWETYYLGSGGTFSMELDPGEPSRFRYDPDDPTPSVGGPLLQPPGKQADNRSVEARSDVLVFTGSALTANLDVVGPVSARVHLRTSRPYADIFVRLCDVDPRGVSRNVVDGIRRLDPSTVPAADVSIGADGILAVDVELFPTAYRFKVGHRLRVQIAGGAFPRYARNLGTDEHFASATRGVTCDFEIFHDRDHRSSVSFGRLTGVGG